MRVHALAAGSMLLLALPFVSACGAPSDGEDANEEVLSFTDTSEKADAVSSGAVVKGNVANRSYVTNTLPANKYWGWKFTVPADGYGFDATANRTSGTAKPVVYVYGPISGKNAGKQLAKGNANTHGYAEAPIILKKGTYLVVVGEATKKSLPFKLSIDLFANACDGIYCEDSSAGGCSGDGTAASPSHICGCVGGYALWQVCHGSSSCTMQEENTTPYCQ